MSKKNTANVPQVEEEKANGWGAEHELVAAVISRALADFIGYGSTGGWESKDLYIKRAKQWIFADGRHPWSFFWCCQQINLCPSRVRREISKPEVQKRLVTYAHRGGNRVNYKDTELPQDARSFRGAKVA